MTTESAHATFDAHAVGYEAPRRRLIPPFDAFYGTAVDALALLSRPPRRVLDLGAALSPGGVFVNAEQVAGPAPSLDRRYREWHEARARAAGSDDAEWAGALERMRHDQCADVESQLRWLREAGFEEADCLFKEYRFAVLFGRRGVA